MSSYRYYLIDSKDTEGVHDPKTGITHALPQDLDQLFTLRPRFWKEGIIEQNIEVNVFRFKQFICKDFFPRLYWQKLIIEQC